jgi:hypothetical protein
MLNGLSARLLLGFLILLATFRVPLFSQSMTPCPTGEALLSSSDPVYADAMELQHRLENHNFTVRCIFPTKLGSIFMVDVNGVLQSTVEGEACFRTNRGDLGVFFLPKPQTFADFKITERSEGGGYVYRFSGTPRVSQGDKFKFETARRNYFLKSDHLLFIADDNHLLASLEGALHLQPSAP